MEIGNEKQNKTTNQSDGLGSKQQGQWRAVCGADQRFYFVNLDTRESQWLPPTELWSSKYGLPYGWEAALINNSLKYYINHANKISTLEDPRSEADQVSTHLQMAATRARKIQIKRDPSLGFGFVAGSEKPVVIRSVITGGPSHGKLFPNDQILKVNGEDVSEVPQERVISLIKSCISELEMDVVSSEDLQDAKNQGQRRSSLMSRATRERRRSSPVNVRFAEDMVQYIGPAEQARRGSLPVLPNVLKVYLENGQTRSFHYNPKTTVQEIFNALGPKLDIKAMEYFCLVLSGPQKNQLSFLQNHEKVSEIYLNRNCSRSSWVCKLRICFIPRDPNEVLEKDPVAFDYLYDQISKDIVEGLYEIDLRYDLAIKLAALHMQQKATEAKHKMPTKISVKGIEKDFDGLEHFIPENIINGVKLKDLRKVLDQQIKFNQTLAGLGQRYLTSKECKQQYLKLASELVSYGGKYFNVILYSNDGGSSGGGNTKSRKPRHQEATVLVSPKYGLSQMVKGKINVLCQLAELEQISGFSVSFHAEGKRLLTISVVDNKDLVLLMKPLDSMDLVTFTVGYQKLWNTTTAKLTVKGERKEPLAPLTDHDIPSYASLHRVIPDTWSYPSFLQVPGSNSDHHFYLDLSKDPPKYTPSSLDLTNGPVGETSSVNVDNNHIPPKRSSEDITSSEGGEKNVPPESVSGKRLKVDAQGSSNEQKKCTSLEIKDHTEMADSTNKERTLYSIAEESQYSNNKDEEPVEDDYISQLALAEQIWRKNRNDRIEISMNESSSESESGGTKNADRNDTNTEDSKVFDKNIETKDRKQDSDDDDDDDDDSGEEIEIFHIEKEPSDKEQVEHIDEVKLKESDKGDDEDKMEATEGKMLNQGLHISKKDHIKVDELEQDELLDINDIDFDDQPGVSSGSLDLLADFSFTGELNPQEKDSPAESKNEDVLMNQKEFQQDDGDDDYNDDDDDDLYKQHIQGAQNSELSSNLGIDSSDGFVFISERKPEENEKENELEKSNQLMKSKGNGEIVFEGAFEGAFDGLSSEEIKDFDKKGNLDGTENDLEDKTLKNYKSTNISSNKDDDQDAEQSHSENVADEVGIKLLSYKQRDEQDTQGFKGNPSPVEFKVCNPRLHEDDNSMDGDYHVERKDSDSSSLTSQDSWQADNSVNSNFGYLKDSKVFDVDERYKSSYINEQNNSNEKGDTLDKFDAKVSSNNLGRADKENFILKNELLDSENSLERLGNSENYGDTLPGRKDLDDEDQSLNSFISTKREEEKLEDEVEVGNQAMTHSEISSGDSKTDMTIVDSKSSPMVLILENDPGESEDTLESLDKDSVEKKNDILKKEDIDFQEFSLMDWIIPPPPGSTEELLDSDIFVASPPPSSPGFESISSPPVELNDTFFNELEIDGMILPPPPMGSYFSSDIRIVSPPPLHSKASTQKEEANPSAKRDHNIITGIESNRQQLGNLTLEDSRHVGGGFEQGNVIQSRSSSGSVLTDDYNSESMVSCYSLSNDSQRTSEDEFILDEERSEIFGDFEEHVGNIALCNQLEPDITVKEAEEESLDSQEMTPFEKSQRTQNENEIQREKVEKLQQQNRQSRNNEVSVVYQEKGQNNGLRAIEQIPLKEKSTMGFLTNGLQYEEDYDCLDEVTFTLENDISVNKGLKAKRGLQDLSPNRTVSLPTRKNDKQFIDEIETNDSMENSTALKASKLEQPVKEPTSEKGYAKDRENWLDRMEKSGNAVESNRIIDNFSPKISPKMKDRDTNRPLLNDGEGHKNDPVNSILEDTPLRVSGNENVPTQPNTSGAVFLPGYLLKDSKGKSSEDVEMNPPMSDWSLEFESEAATDEDQSPRFQRKMPARIMKNERIPSKNREDNSISGDKGDMSSSDESGKMDGSVAMDKNSVDENTDEMLLDGESLDLKKSCLSAKAETKDLTKRLELRLQGCVDDCQKSVLKASYLPYTISSGKWKEGVRSNAEFFASDIKLLNKNVQELNGDVIATLKASQETLQSLVSSFVLAATSQQRVSLYSVRMLAGILNDVVALYYDVVSKVELAVRFYPDKTWLKPVAEKTTAMTALIASLNRTLKRL